MTMKFLTFRRSNQRWALPTDAIVAVVTACHIDALPGAPAPVLGVFNFRGQIVPVVEPAAKIEGAGGPGRDDQFIVVERGRRYALIATDVEEVVDVCPEDIVAASAVADGVNRTAGVIRLLGGLVVIHDPDRFMAPEHVEALSQVLEVEPDV